jgi:hypothetical protein
MGSIPNGRVVAGIPDKKPVASPHGDSGRKPQPSPRPETGKPYAAAKPQVDNYAARRAELKAHHDALRTDADTGKKY